MASRHIGFIGAGNMATAILRGLRSNPPRGFDLRLLAADPDAAQRERVQREDLADTAASAAELLDALGGIDDPVLVLAVKPQMLSAVGDEIARRGFSGAVISILAGSSSDRVRDALGGRCRVIRAMPNTPAAIGAGMTAVAAGQGARPEDLELARALFSSVGSVVEIDEPLMDAFTAVAGSGPAYVFLLAEAMQRAAEELDLPPEHAPLIAAQTVAGAGRLLLEAVTSGEASAKQLRERVTSKGGTTEAALREMDRRGSVEGIVAAIRAARDRGRELSGG